MLPDFADGFRKLGHEVTTAISTRHPRYEHFKYDIDLNSDVLGRPGTRWLNRSARAMRILKLIAQHDLFVFIWAGASLRWGTEVPLLKKLGKRIVWIFCGSDVRHPMAYEQEFSSMVLSDDQFERVGKDPLDQWLQGVRLAERYSDLIISQPNQSGLAVRPYDHFFLPLKLSQYKHQSPGREVPVVVHAPSVKSIKGTKYILQAIERLRAEGLRFEFQLLHGVSNQEVLSSLENADVVIEQVNWPLHGKLGLEAMASECALASCNQEDYEPIPPNRPIWHVDPRNVNAQLKRLIIDRELRVRLAHEGRAYVKRYHDHVQVVQRILNALSLGEARKYDHYPTFYAERFRLPEGVTIPDNLKRMTAQVVQRWGLSESSDPNDLIRRGLMSSDGLNPSQSIPRWKPSSREDEVASGKKDS